MAGDHPPSFAVVLLRSAAVDGRELDEGEAMPGGSEISFHVLAIQRVMRREIEAGNAQNMSVLINAFETDLAQEIFDL